MSDYPEHDRLAAITELLPRPCPAPDIAGGYDRCTCGSGQVWPCNLTRAAWIAAGLDPRAEMDRVFAEVRRELAADYWEDEPNEAEVRTEP